MRTTAISFLVALGLLAATGARAQDAAAPAAEAAQPSEEQRTALDARVAEFSAVMTSPDMKGFFGFLPPGIRAALARQSGLSEAEVEQALDQQVAATMAGVSIDSFDLDAAGATFHTTPDGSRSYALLPTAIEVTLPGQGRSRATAETLAFKDGGEWYLVRVSEPSQQQVLVAAYPEFAGVAFAPSVAEPLE